MNDAAAQGHLVRMRCVGCNRSANFLPEDLAKVYGGSRPALVPLFPCSRCRNTDFVHISTYDPGIADFGRITIRRPGPTKIVQTWRNETFHERSRVWYEKLGDRGF